MSVPFKLALLRAVTAALKEITPANGYQSDLSDFDPGDGHPTARVYRGRAWFGESDPIPMVSILEAAAPAEYAKDIPAETPTGEFSWIIIVQGFVQDDPQNPTDPAYLLMADVRQRLMRERSRKKPGTNFPDPFGLRGQYERNRVVDIKVGPGVVRPADDVSAKAYFWCGVTLTIVDNAEAPYT